MKEISKIINDGMYLSEYMNRPTALPMLSLEIALRAYFSTYHDVGTSLFLFSEDGLPVEDNDSDYLLSYYISCFETIVHFQHFAELVCKAFLRTEHPLLVSEATHNSSIFYKLLNNVEISSEEQDKLRSIDFSKSLERICTLAKETKKEENQIRYDLFAKWREPLEQLNILRNRLWHRSTFILRYGALDRFIGRYILPFVNDIVSLPEYQNTESTWKYKPLNCNIDPLTSIATLLNANSPYNKTQIAFLKELGRAAYNNPLWIGPLFPDWDPVIEQRNNSLQNAFENEALVYLEHNRAHKVSNCPVCGMKSLLITEAYVTCIGCSLRIGRELDNASYGFHIQETWFS